MTGLLYIDGTIEEIAQDAKRIEAEGADGFDLLAYRYIEPNKVNELIVKVKSSINVPPCLCRFH